MNLLAPSVFHALCVAIVFGACVFFFALDTVRLVKALRAPRSPEVSDRIFGAVVGLACAVVGVLGMYLRGQP